MVMFFPLLSRDTRFVMVAENSFPSIVERPENETGFSSPFIREVNAWSSTFASPTRLHGMVRSLRKLHHSYCHVLIHHDRIPLTVL
jgi:hypothetical protein